MVNALPFIRFVNLRTGSEPDALLGFSLPFLPDMLTSRWLSSSNAERRLDEALQLQVRLISAFWNQGAAVWDRVAWDLRFVATDELPGVAIALICRYRHPPRVPARQFHDQCLASAKHTQQLFADYGYELLPLVDESALTRYLTPFPFPVVGEIRKAETMLTIEDAYTEYEFYVTYPWQWAIQSRLRLFEALLHRQSNCLVSVSLEPTQLNPHEQAYFSRATSTKLRDLLCNSGAAGEAVYNVYADYARDLRQPYMSRISLAASTPQALEHIGRVFLDEFHTSQPGTAPILQYPQNQQEWQWACQSISHVECIPWGRSSGMDLPGTSRLRYLVDARTASMAFRLPVARYGDMPGVPVRSLAPTVGNPPTMGTMGHNFYSASTLPSPPSTPSTRSTLYPPSPPSTSSASSAATPASEIPLSGVLDIQRPEDLVGQTLGSCQVEALLGQGGFGAVYRARQLHLDRLVAVKVVLATISTTDRENSRKMVLRFDREAQAIARLDHPHILTLYEYQSHPLPYIVMPYIAGGSLADEMKSSGHRPLSVSGVAIILNQVASAIDHAHQQQLIHRDIKPHNLLRHQDGRVLLADFGIVQFENEDQTALTSSKGHSPYTPSYASPEQHQWLKVDYRSDIYSLAIVIYELLCGQRPFKQPYQHVKSPPPPMNTFGVQVSPSVEAVVFKALAKQPEQRYQSAGEMASEFRAAMK